MANMKRDVVVRVNDLRKLVTGAQHELQNLSSMTDVINTKQLEDVFKSVEANTKFLVDASGANERSSASLQVVIILVEIAPPFAIRALLAMMADLLNACGAH